MIFSYLIKSSDLLDYLPDGIEPVDVRVKVSVDQYGAEPEVGLMEGGARYEGWDWGQSPVDGFRDAVESYMRENGEELANGMMAEHMDYVRDIMSERI